MTKHNLFLKTLLGATALTVVSAGSAFAQTSTPAGTSVENTFTLNYEVDGTTQDEITNDNPGDETTFTVDRVVDLTVAFTGGDTSPAPGETNVDLTFTVTNEGNDTQGYALSPVDSTGDDFDPTVVGLFYILPGTTVEVAYDPNNPPELAPGEVLTVIVRRDIDSGQVDGDTADIILVADTLVPANFVDPNDNTVTPNPNAGDVVTGDTTNDLGAIETVLADDSGDQTGDDQFDGTHSDTGTYVVAAADLVAEKTVTVFAQDGANCATASASAATPANQQMAIPGACVEYRITATNSGSIAATAIQIVDTLPGDLEFAVVDVTGFTAGSFDAATNALTDGDDCAADACVVTFGSGTLPAPVAPATEVVGYVTVRAYIK